MIGDLADIVRRMRTVLPNGWFGDTAPILDTLLAGVGDAWVWLFDTIKNARAQLRLRTASGRWLDTWVADFQGQAVVRRRDEGDEPFRARAAREIFRTRGTRAALESVLLDLTGRPPVVFEPRRPLDTGCYGRLSTPSTTSLAYGICGGWGSLTHPYQIFVTAYRLPQASGLGVAGWGTGSFNTGFSAYSDLTSIRNAISDEEINRAVQRVLPLTATAWLRIVS